MPNARPTFWTNKTSRSITLLITLFFFHGRGAAPLDCSSRILGQGALWIAVFAGWHTHCIPIGRQYRYPLPTCKRRKPSSKASLPRPPSRGRELRYLSRCLSGRQIPRIRPCSLWPSQGLFVSVGLVQGHFPLQQRHALGWRMPPAFSPTAQGAGPIACFQLRWQSSPNAWGAGRQRHCRLGCDHGQGNLRKSGRQ